MQKYVIDRLSESSTWRGLIGLATAAGVTVAPAQQEAIVALGLALIGAINVFRREASIR